MRITRQAPITAPRPPAMHCHSCCCGLGGGCGAARASSCSSTRRTARLTAVQRVRGLARPQDTAKHGAGGTPAVFCSLERMSSFGMNEAPRLAHSSASKDSRAALGEHHVVWR